MRCKTCQYPLWDLVPGACPECGESFDPTTHRFKPGSVRFCCPHCDQAYFGDGEDGHLNPPAFNCVGCGEAIAESECIIRPREDGSYEDQTVPDHSPWHDPTRTLWRRFWATVGMGMIKPGSLGRGLPADASLLSGFWFFLLVNTLSLVLGFGPFILLAVMLPVIFGNAGAPPPALTLVAGIGIVSYVPLLFIVLCLLGGLVHICLRITGPTAGGYGRTVASIGFGSAPLIIGAVPFLGYCLQTPAQIWSVVSTIMVLSGAQAVSGLRASIAVLTPVFLAIIAYIGFIVFMVMTGPRAPARAFPNQPPPPQAAAASGPNAVMIGSMDLKEVAIDSPAFLKALAEADSLPGPKEIGELAGVTSTITRSDDVAYEKTYRGRDFEAWSIPGLFVFKVGAGGGYVRPTSITIAKPMYELKYASHGGGVSMSSSVMLTGDACYRKVVSAIEQLGGVGRDLNRAEFESWVERHGPDLLSGSTESVEPTEVSTEEKVP